MSCREFERRIVSDDPVEQQRARSHAARCETCARVLTAHRRLSERVRTWVETTPGPPAGAEERLLLALRRQAGVVDDGVEARVGGKRAETSAFPDRLDQAGRSGAGRSEEDAPDRREPAVPRLAWVALAAAAGLAALAVAPRLLTPAPAPTEARRLMAADALAEALEAEQTHARAIARLERAASPVLATATSPDTPARYASLLLTYQDRLDFLDRTIADIRDFLADNPGHAGGRTLLLAAYADKTRVLQEVVELEEEIPS